MEKQEFENILSEVLFESIKPIITNQQKYFLAYRFIESVLYNKLRLNVREKQLIDVNFALFCKKNVNVNDFRKKVLELKESQLNCVDLPNYIIQQCKAQFLDIKC